MLELVETAEQIGRKHRFEFLSYLLSLPRKEIMDVLNYSASARPGIEVDTKEEFRCQFACPLNLRRSGRAPPEPLAH
jgi:hypothetical protein